MGQKKIKSFYSRNCPGLFSFCKVLELPGPYIHVFLIKCSYLFVSPFLSNFVHINNTITLCNCNFCRIRTEGNPSNYIGLFPSLGIKRFRRKFVFFGALFIEKYHLPLARSNSQLLIIWGPTQGYNLEILLLKCSSLTSRCFITVLNHLSFQNSLQVFQLHFSVSWIW